MMNNTVPGRGQYFLAAILGILAFAAGGISLAMNAQFGLKTGLVMAAIFILSDCAKIVLPMVAAAMPGPSAKRQLAYGVAVSISLMAATSFLLEQQATRQMQIQARAEMLAGRKADTDRIRAELDLITETATVGALGALAKAKKSAAEAEAANGGCLSKCQARMAEHAEILERLGRAKRRNALNAELAALAAELDEISPEAFGASAILAGMTGGTADRIARNEAMLKAIAMLIILELLATFSGEAGMLFIVTWKARRKRTKAVRKAPKSEITELKTAENPVEKSKSSYWLTRLSKERPDIAARVLGGEMSCYKGCIEAGIRKAAEKQKPEPKTDWTKPEAYEASDSLQIAKS